MSTFIASLKQEIVDLEAQLAAHPIYGKLQDARRLLSRYDIDVDNHQDDDSTLASNSAATITGVARHVLAGCTEPMPTRQILELLIETE